MVQSLTASGRMVSQMPLVPPLTLMAASMLVNIKMANHMDKEKKPFQKLGKNIKEIFMKGNQMDLLPIRIQKMAVM